jgi:adenylosuccinate lyase
MIERYTRPEIGAIWKDENRFSIWLEIELLACEAKSLRGGVPKSAVKRMRANASFDVDRINEIEARTHHDVLAFIGNVCEYIGEDSQYFHQGLTSSDLLDTTLAIQMKRASAIINKGIKRLLKATSELAKKYKHTPMMGRSHGIHAEPITFGLKALVWYTELERCAERFRQSVKSISVGKISGAVGTFAFIDPQVEEYVCKKLGLKPAPVSTQVVQRDRHAHFVCAMAMLGSTMDKIATEIRNLQRTDVREVEEPFRKGQRGSSAMPHKRNPIICERITGMARLLRSNAQAALENVALWHERDISHSSVERVILPDCTIMLDYMLDKFSGVLEGLQVYPDAMLNNIDKVHGLIYSQRVMLALGKAGVERDKAYDMVQRNAMQVWKKKKDFKTIIKADKEIRKYLKVAEINDCFNVNHHLRHVDTIFKRVKLI